MCKWNQLTCYFRQNWSLKLDEVRDFQPYTDCQEWELVRSCQLMSTILFSKVCKKALIEFTVVVSSVILSFFFLEFWTSNDLQNKPPFKLVCKEINVMECVA